MLGPNSAQRFITYAKEHHSAWNLFLIIGKVFTAHHLRSFKHTVLAENLLGSPGRYINHLRIIDGDRHEVFVFHFCSAAHGFSRRLGNACNTFSETVAHLGIKSTRRAFKFCRAGNDIEARAAGEFAHRHNGCVDRVEFTGNEALEVLHNGRAHHYGINRTLRLCAVARLADNLDLEAVAGSHHCSLAHRNLAGGYI